MDTNGSIQMAKDAPENIKEKLIFRNDEELDTGMQKVQPLPFLDEDIHKHVKSITDSIPAAQRVNDDIPQRALEIVQGVIREANAGQTTLFKASDLLEITTEAFRYGRGACCDRFQLARKSADKLKEYDATFQQMIEHRIGKRMGEAQRAMKKCRDLLDTAVEYAKEDRDNLVDRIAREDEHMTSDQLEEVTVSAQDNIKDEKAELDLIKHQCERDISDIDSGILQFHGRMASLESEERGELGRQQKQLRRNQDRQEEIRKELKQLEDEEAYLTRAIQTIQKNLLRSSDTREESDKEIYEWKEKIEGLKRRTDIALGIMGHMKKCTDMIIVNAKAKKKEWSHRLGAMDLTSLLDYRDALLAQGVLFSVISSEAKRNSERAEDNRAKLEEEQEEAAQTGFAEAVEGLAEKIDKCVKQIKQFKKEIEDASGRMAEVAREVEDVDAKINQLNPMITLDSLDSRYEERQDAMKQAFRKKGTESVVFNSIGKYN